MKRSFSPLVLAFLCSSAAAGINTLSLEGQVDSSDPQSWQFELSQQKNANVVLICDEDTPPFERHIVPGLPLRDQTLEVRGLKAATSYTCFAGKNENDRHPSNEVRLTTEPLPEDLVVPEIVVPAEDLAEVGFILFNSGNFQYSGSIIDGFDPRLLTSDSNYLVIMDAEGNVRWWYPGPGAGDIEANYLGAERILFGGQGVGPAFGPTILGLDKEIKFTAPQTEDAPNEMQNSDGLYFNHDARISQDGLSVYTFVHTHAPEDAANMGYVIKEFSLTDVNNDGVMDNTLWIWDSFTAAEAGEIDHTNSDPRYEDDALHANSVWEQIGADGEDYVYVSHRHTNRVIKIHRATGTVMWELGFGSPDFVLLEENGMPASPDRWFFNQHDVTYRGNIMTVHDNGSDRWMAGGLPYSRVLQLKLDEELGTARILSEYTEDNWIEPFWGGYDVEDNGNQMVAMGHCDFCDSLFNSHNTSFVYLDAWGRTIWRADVAVEEVENMTYRADRIDGCDIFNIEDYCPRL